MSEAIPGWAVPGAKVVCISQTNPTKSAARQGLPAAVVGHVYTVVRSQYVPRWGRAFIQLEGMGDAAWYAVGCFRPVTKREAEQDIAEHFAHLLNTRAPELV